MAGDKQLDIFDGLAVKAESSKQIGYVLGEQVGAIYHGEVTLKVTALEAQTLPPYQEPPPETKCLPGKASLGSRISNWMRGKR